jgi:5-hydroxyisourate hydrolase
MITTHVLDTSIGRPAAGVSIILSLEQEGARREIGRGITDADGRCKTLTGGAVDAGTYVLWFDTATYFLNLGRGTFYPSVEIRFTVAAGQKYHVPLLLSPYGYSTYRGS